MYERWLWSLSSALCAVVCACHGPARLTQNWEVGEIAADSRYVFGATLDGIRRVGTDGSAATVLVPYRTAVFEESQHRPDRIAIDDVFVYWTQRDAAPGIDSVKRIAKSGGPPETVMKVQTAAQSNPIHIEVDASSVFVLSYGRGPYGNPVTDTEAGYEGGTIARVRKEDRSVAELRSGVKAGSGLAVDDQFVYWAEGGTYRHTTSGLSDYIYNADGRILRVPKTGGPVQVIAAGLDNPRELRLFDGRLQFRMGRHYEKNSFTEESGFFEVNPKDGQVKKIAERPFFLHKQKRYAQRDEFYGPPGLHGRRNAHHYIERETSPGKTEILYKTDEDMSAFILEGNHLFWLQGTSYAVMKLAID